MEMIEITIPIEDMVKSVAPNTVYWLLILLGVNILLMVLKFILDWYRDNHENHNYKIKKISEKTIDIESEVYKRLQELATFQKDDSHKMLDKIIEMDDYIYINGLYLSRKYKDEVVKTMDYFKGVVTDFKKKDNKKENQLFNKLCSIFYGE